MPMVVMVTVLLLLLAMTILCRPVKDDDYPKVATNEEYDGKGIMDICNAGVVRVRQVDRPCRASLHRVKQECSATTLPRCVLIRVGRSGGCLAAYHLLRARGRYFSPGGLLVRQWLSACQYLGGSVGCGRWRTEASKQIPQHIIS